MFISINQHFVKSTLLIIVKSKKVNFNFKKEVDIARRVQDTSKVLKLYKYLFKNMYFCVHMNSINTNLNKYITKEKN